MIYRCEHVLSSDTIFTQEKACFAFELRYFSYPTQCRAGVSNSVPGGPEPSRV